MFVPLGRARVDYWWMIRRAAALFALCAGTDVQVVDMYRAMQKPDGGKETQKVENNNLADIHGVLRYIHQEVIVEHAQGDPERTARKYGIDSIARYRVQVKNPSGVEAGAPVPGFGSMFSAFDFGVATNDDALKELAKVGDFVGVQLHSQDDASIIVAYPYYWFSLPGACPNLPWKCIPGAKQTACQTKRSELEVMPPVCADSGCAGKKDDAALKCAADFSKPDTMSGCCLRYGPKDKVAIKGGLCNNGEKAPTGQPGCVYLYESLEDKDFLSLDNLVGITAAKCGNSGERTCTDWADWRENCYDPDKKYKRRFKKTDLGDGKMKVDVEETDYCVEYDLHPYCQDAPPDLCNNVDCQSLSPSEKEIGLEYWLGRCEESHNTKRAEGINFAFAKTPEKNHLMVDKELLDSNFKCSSGGMRCTPNLDGGLYCTRQYGGVCTPCFIPGTKVPFPAANTTPTCPFNVLAEGGYTPPAGTECKSRDAADICCLYKVGGACSQPADGSSAELSASGYISMMAASLEDPEHMFNFAKRWIEDNGGKVENEDQLKEEAYWLWQVHPPKRYEEAWKEFQANLKASTAVNFGPGSGTEAPGLPGDTTTPATPEPGKNKVHRAHYPVWIAVASVGACGFLAAAWFYLYRNPRQRRQRGSFVEEETHRSLQMTRM